MPAGRPRSFDEAEVLEKATQAFWTGGFASTSVGDLEAATGLKRQSLYNAFGDKRGLYEACLDHYEKTRARGFSDLLSGPDPMAGVERVLQAWAHGARSSGCRGCFFLNTISELSGKDPEMVRRIGRLLDQQQDELTDTLRAARDAGALAPHLEPRATARRPLTQASRIGASTTPRSARGIPTTIAR